MNKEMAHTTSVQKNVTSNGQCSNKGAEPSRSVRSEQLIDHPLFTRTVLLPTTPIRTFYKVVKRAVVLREMGIWLAAPSGVGKSSALDMVVELMTASMPTLLVLKHNMLNQQMPSIRAFFKNFLATLRHYEQKGETSDVRQRLVNTLIDDARVRGSSMVLLMIDEAQAMTIQDFKFLKDVSNALEQENVQLVTILMGQDPDLSELIIELRRARRLDLISRFALQRIEFVGYSCVDHLREILREIDTAIYPIGTEYTWTSYFFPRAYESGFRLENEAQAFFKAIVDATPKKLEGLCIPARQTFLAIRTFVYANSKRDTCNMHLPEDAWKSTVAYARIADAMLLMAVNDATQAEVRI